MIHFADLHLGVESGGRANPQSGLNQRIHDVCDRLDEVCACAEDERVHLVVFCGDAFKHQHPTPTLQSLFAERIRRLARAGVGVFLLIGNHDLPKMAALAHPFSIYTALEVEGVVVGDRARVYTVPLRDDAPVRSVQVAALPHYSRQQVLARLPDDTPAERVDDEIREAVHARVRAMAGEVDAAVPALFAGHCHVNQAELSTAQSFFGVSELEVTLSSLASALPVPYFALGHVHRRQVLSHDPFVAYSGSLERVDFSEGQSVRVGADGGVRTHAPETKGFYRFDLVGSSREWRLDGEPSFREVSARDFCTIRVDAAGSEDANARALSGIRAALSAGASVRDAFVRIVVSLDATERVAFRARELKDAVPDAYDVRVTVEAPDDSVRVRDPRFAARMSEIEALERYVETRPDWAEDSVGILRAGRALIEHVLR